MEISHVNSVVHWDLEPERANVGQASRLPRERESARRCVVGFADGGRRDARPTLRFMESPKMETKAPDE